MLKKGEPIGYHDKEGTSLCVGDWIEGPEGRGRINGTKVSLNGSRVPFDKVEFSKFLRVGKSDEPLDITDIKAAKQDRERLKKSVLRQGDFIDIPNGTGILCECGNEDSSLYVILSGNRLYFDVKVKTSQINLAEPLNKVKLMNALRYYGYSMDWETGSLKKCTPVYFSSGTFVTDGLGFGVVDSSSPSGHVLKVWVQDAKIQQNLVVETILDTCTNSQIAEFHNELLKLGYVWVGKLTEVVNSLSDSQLISEVKRRRLGSLADFEIALSKATEDEIVAELKARRFTGTFSKVYTF